jgi:heme/copper-type cytochrome/quinol oxidase subunit 4
MKASTRQFPAMIARFWQFVLLFAVVRVAIGIVFIVMAGRDDAAWSLRATVIVALAALVCFVVAMAVRRWAPPRRIS